MSYDITSDVPMPTSARAKYPFAEMAVGDSFGVPDGEARRVRGAASDYGRRNGMRFSVKAHEGGYRVWRVE